MSGCGLFFRELLGEALAGSVEADRGGVLRAVEGDGELRSGQALTRGEAEDLLVILAELLQRGDDLRQIGAFATCRRRTSGGSSRKSSNASRFTPLKYRSPSHPQHLLKK